MGKNWVKIYSLRHQLIKEQAKSKPNPGKIISLRHQIKLLGG